MGILKIGCVFLFVFSIQADARSVATASRFSATKNFASAAKFTPAQNTSPAGSTDPIVQYGAVTSFLFTSTADQVTRTNLLYVPQSIQGVPGPFKTLMFLHGGGTTYTSTDAGAISVAQNYLKDFTAYAETNKIILIFPTTALGWGRQTSYFFREFLPFIESRLPINDNYFVLAGHSMGGMGITREYPYVTDLFSGVLGMAAGIQDQMINEDAILPYFNGTPYIELNGNQDESFPDFLVQEKKFLDELQNLSTTLGMQSKYQLITFDGGHDYSIPLVYSKLDELFTQPKMHDPKYFTTRLGVMHTPAQAGYPGMLPIPKIDGVLDHQYYLGVSDYADAGTTSAYVYLHVQVSGHSIAITSDNNTLNPKKLNLALDSTLVDLNSPVTVTLDGKVVFNGMAPIQDQQQQQQQQNAPMTANLSIPMN